MAYKVVNQHLEEIHRKTASALRGLQYLFKPGCRLTFVMRQPDQKQGYMVVSETDEMGELIKLFERIKASREKAADPLDIVPPIETKAEKEFKKLLDSCYDAIAKVIWTEEGLDGFQGTDLLQQIEKAIGQTENIKAWNNPNTPTT